MFEPNVDPDEDIEGELVSSAREMSAGFVAFASLDPKGAVLMGRHPSVLGHARDRHPPMAPGPLAHSGSGRPRR